MKTHFLKNALSIILLFAIVASLVSFFSFRLKNTMNDIWSRIGLNEEIGIGNIQSAFLEGYFYQMNPSAAKKIALEDRATLVSELLVFAKKYVNSPEFLDDYEWYKNEKKPKAPSPCRSKKEIQEELINSTKDIIAQNEDALQDFEGDVKKEFMNAINKLKVQLKEYENPDNEYLAMMYESEKNQYEMDFQRYQEDLKEFEELYPKDIKLMVKDRIEMFLKITEGIDYNAELKTAYGKKVFVNPIYERKPEQWKFGFRCGKEVTETARKFAKEWLAELQ